MKESGKRPGEQVAPSVVVNTHLHVPPNFSAFETVEEAVATAGREGVRVLGTSNFHDFHVYERFAAAAGEAGVVSLFGCEIISVLDDAERRGHRVNDPENPGRAYLCGKGIPDPAHPGPFTQERMDAARTLNEARMETMIGLLVERFAAAGLPTQLTYAAIAGDVARRADVPADWVVLQERHVAEAFQAALFAAAGPDRRPAILERAFDRAPRSAPDDPIAAQSEIRSRLMKAGGAAFVPESPVAFEEAYRFILGLGAMPCYPTLADGADPICEFETPAAALAERVMERGIFAAELIPIRNRPAVVDEYVAAFREAGLLVLAGTEHNTRARIPIEPLCLGGARPSPASVRVFLEATCVVVAHQHLRARGEPGYVDDKGRLTPGFPDAESRIRHFAELGEHLIAEASPEASR